MKTSDSKAKPKKRAHGPRGRSAPPASLGMEQAELATMEPKATTLHVIEAQAGAMVHTDTLAVLETLQRLCPITEEIVMRPLQPGEEGLNMMHALAVMADRYQALYGAAKSKRHGSASWIHRVGRGSPIHRPDGRLEAAR